MTDALPLPMTNPHGPARQPLRAGTRSILRQYWFAGTVGLFVVLSSFFYGLVSGLRHPSRATPAQAFSLGAPAPSGETIEGLTDGIVVSSMLDHAKINGRAAEVGTVYSDGSIPVLIDMQLKKWSGLGLAPIGRGTTRRGVAVVRDTTTGEGYSLSLWLVPRSLRDKLSDGHSVQGFVTHLKPGKGERSTAGIEGELPDVPLMPGGSAGAVFSAEEFGGTSSTASYSLLDDIDRVLEYYDEVLPSAGWQAFRGEGTPEGVAGSRTYRRGDEELVLLASTLPSGLRKGAGDGAGPSPRTLLLITKAPARDIAVNR